MVSIVNDLLIPKFILAHDAWFKEQGISMEHTDESTMNSRGYRVDFKDTMVQLLWEEWQMAAFVVFSAVHALTDSHNDLTNRRR